MNPQDQPMNEEQAFKELMAEDQFDDSIDARHQRDLRSQVLQTFDQCDHGAIESPPRVVRAEQPPRTTRGRKFSYAVAIAVTLIGVISVAVYRMSDSSDQTIVEHRTTPVIEDSEFVASLAMVNAVRNEDSREALFYAIAICQNDLEGRTLFASNDR
jgi:hypothetical protein